MPQTPDRLKHPIFADKLTEKDYNIINGNGCLSNEYVMAAQNILHSQFPLVDGFLSTLLGLVGQFSPIQCGFIQVIHTGRFHWVTVINIFCNSQRSAQVGLYDSLYHGMTDQTKAQVVSLLCPEVDKLVVIV